MSSFALCWIPRVRERLELRFPDSQSGAFTSILQFSSICYTIFYLLPFLTTLVGHFGLTAHIMRLASEFGLFVELLKCYTHY